MNDFNSAEYVVTQAKEGKNLRTRRLLLLLYIVLGLGISGTLVALKLVPVVAIVPLLLWILVHFTWRKVNVEYKYVVAHSRVALSECYSSGSDKVTLDVPVSDFEFIGKLPEAEPKMKEYSPAKIYDYRGSVSKTPAAVGLIELSGVKTAVMFIYDKRTAGLFRLYNKKTEL